MLSCGRTHTAIVRLHLVKGRVQVDPGRYRGSGSDDGLRGLAPGWAPTLQGLCKFGLYEGFKTRSAELLGPEAAHAWRTSPYPAASASAESFADVALAPMGAVKVRIQTRPLPMGAVKVRIQTRPLPTGAVKVRIQTRIQTRPLHHDEVRLLGAHGGGADARVVPQPQHQCTKAEQLAATFVAAYVAGTFCAVVCPSCTRRRQYGRRSAAQTGLRARVEGPAHPHPRVRRPDCVQWFIYDSVKVHFKLPRPPAAQAPPDQEQQEEWVCQRLGPPLAQGPIHWGIVSRQQCQRVICFVF
ncbi:unnamed protein product [Nyctereutes procyonoides]|uniref:(raccoon dog) hypothetical protein n=1 Tax=Nyctereutes procyonoides TaxID=34880 RepID=A0A811ZKJ1_NYCPR|nr:unnamed protein product [Nyctereutes procyonoides]